MLKPYLFLSAVILFGFAVAPSAGKSPQAGSSAKSAAKPPANPTAKGKEIYARDCAMCHGDTGNGQSDLAKDMQLTLKDWTDPKALADQSDQQIFDIIRKGMDKMPPEDASRAKDDDVKSLVLYIRDFSKNPPAPSTAATTSPNSGK
ncbi:MAG: cytochrome c [Terracidiphilus sp.]